MVGGHLNRVRAFARMGGICASRSGSSGTSRSPSGAIRGLHLGWQRGAARRTPPPLMCMLMQMLYVCTWMYRCVDKRTTLHTWLYTWLYIRLYTWPCTYTHGYTHGYPHAHYCGLMHLRGVHSCQHVPPTASLHSLRGSYSCRHMPQTAGSYSLRGSYSCRLIQPLTRLIQLQACTASYAAHTAAGSYSPHPPPAIPASAGGAGAGCGSATFTPRHRGRHGGG